MLQIFGGHGETARLGRTRGSAVEYVIRADTRIGMIVKLYKIV